MLAALAWSNDKLNVLLTGPCGVGKSLIASDLAHAAVRCFRLARLVEELTRYRAQANASAFFR
jgi:DNA replication protein DnaC